jgi:hypothetical protein
MKLGQQRDTIQKLSPPWLATGDAEKFLYVIGLALDVLLEKLNQAMKAHMPGQNDPSSDPLLGADRGILQGIGESHASFSLRLSRAFESWSRAGESRVVLEQVLSVLPIPAYPAAFPLAAIVKGLDSNTWDLAYYGQDLSGPCVSIRESVQNWDWDGLGARWWRSWLVLYSAPVSTGNSGAAASVAAESGGFVTVTGLSGMSSADVGRWLAVSGVADTTNNLGTFQIVEFLSANSVSIANNRGTSDANNGALTWVVGEYQGLVPGLAWGSPGLAWGDTNRSWGLAVEPQVFATMRLVLRTWKSKQTYYRWIVIAFNGLGGQANADYSPYSTDAIGDHNPDGTWAHWSKTVAGQRVPARVTKTYLDQNRPSLDGFGDGTGVYSSSYEHTDTG